ncbi:MAG: twin-arginine translocase TatA/TatE family subunit [Alphaproteobacteria bacterium]|nr:twin-arginine translocase TatA/TatE family subunit [Alphaproteobacteria bacterium]
MSPSIWQILIVVALIMLLFGAGKLPRIMGDMAEGIKSFKRGMRDEDESVPSPKSDKAPGPKDTLN